MSESPAHHQLNLSTRPLKRKKIGESDLPWIIRNKLFGSELRPELRTTLSLLQAWSANPKQVRASIVNTPGCLAFPDSEWLNLVQGKTINLDNVFSGFSLLRPITSVPRISEKSNLNLELKTPQNQLPHTEIGQLCLTSLAMPTSLHWHGASENVKGHDCVSREEPLANEKARWLPNQQAEWKKCSANSSRGMRLSHKTWKQQRVWGWWYILENACYM